MTRSLPQTFTAIALMVFVAAGCAQSAASVKPREANLTAEAKGFTATAPVSRSSLLGYSVKHRPITAHELGDSLAGTRVLVVGCIHGNERAGISVARRLEAMVSPSGVDLWVLDDLNPDGAGADTRQNAHRVDLNRNFPYRWLAAGRPGDQQYPGPRPLSEPESRIAYRLVLRLRPQVTIYFHQPLGLVDESGGDSRVERRFAALSGLPLKRLTRYPGSAAGWQNHRLPSSTAFVVELPPGNITQGSANHLAHAVLTLARDLPRRAAISNHPQRR